MAVLPFRLTGGGLRRPWFILVILGLALYFYPTAFHAYNEKSPLPNPFSSSSYYRPRSLFSSFYRFAFGNKHGYNGRRDPPVQGCPADSPSPESDISYLNSRLQQQRLRGTKGCVLLLAQDTDLQSILDTLANFEVSFNRNFRYNYVFLKEDTRYTREFEQAIRKALPKDAGVEFGVIPDKDWIHPDWPTSNEMQKSFEKIGDHENSGRRRSRYFAGPFALHPLLKKYDYYWRLEWGVQYYCTLQYDPFEYMARHDKVYGWVISTSESSDTISTLFDTVLQWRDEVVQNSTQFNRFTSPRGQIKLADMYRPDGFWNFFLTDSARTWTGTLKQSEKYNLCVGHHISLHLASSKVKGLSRQHFWPMFEIGDLRFFRGDAYQSLFNYLDASGGFYSESWGDGPVRSLALGVLADYDRIHYFEDIAFKYSEIAHNPEAGSNIGCGCKDVSEWLPDTYGTAGVDKMKQHSCLLRWRALDIM